MLERKRLSLLPAFSIQVVLVFLMMVTGLSLPLAF
jgi:hypothetical protein